MKPATILSLKVGDAVRTMVGNIMGTVTGFNRNCVRIAWEDGQVMHYADDDLAAIGGVVKSFPFDVEDTRPE